MIIIVFGLPGTGKSFFSRHLADEIGAAYLNTDIVRGELNLQGLYTPQSKRRVYDRLLLQAGQKRMKYKNVIVDGTFQRRNARRRFSERASQWKQPVRFIEMRSTDRTVRKRISEEREYSEADFKVYRQIKYNFEKMERPHLVLQSDALSLEEMINKAKAYIHEERTD